MNTDYSEAAAGDIETALTNAIRQYQGDYSDAFSASAIYDPAVDEDLAYTARVTFSIDKNLHVIYDNKDDSKKCSRLYEEDVTAIYEVIDILYHATAIEGLSKNVYEEDMLHDAIHRRRETNEKAN